MQRPSTVDFAVCAWFVGATVLWTAVVLTPVQAPTYRAYLTIGLAALAVITITVTTINCRRVQSGKKLLAVFLTTMSVCCVVLAPFAAFGGGWDHAQDALGTVACVLALAGTAAAWVPGSNRYFRAARTSSSGAS